MDNFRGLTGQQAKTEFFLEVMYLSDTDETKATALFAEAREAEVLPDEVLDEFEKRAKALIPIYAIEENKDKREQVIKFRDDLSEACGI